MNLLCCYRVYARKQGEADDRRCSFSAIRDCALLGAAANQPPRGA